MYDLGIDGYGNDSVEYLGQVAQLEAEHVTTLTQVITDLGGTPVEEATYDFSYTTLEEFLATGAVLEGFGVVACGGAAQYLQEAPDLLTAALTIHGNDACHAAYLNVITWANPFPTSF